MLRVTGLCAATVNSPHKGPVTLKMFPFDVVIMEFMGIVSEMKLNKWAKSIGNKLEQHTMNHEQWACALAKTAVNMVSKNSGAISVIHHTVQFNTNCCIELDSVVNGRYNAIMCTKERIMDSLHRRHIHRLGAEVWCACLTFCPPFHSYNVICIKGKLTNAEWPQIRPIISWARFVVNVNDSGVRKLAINSSSMSSAGKPPGRLCQTLGPCRTAGSL